MRRLSDIDLRLIRVFCTIVDCGGFPGAQIVLNMAQSTLSTHLASLEAKLGSKLCHRGRGGFRLTPAGEETYDSAQELLRNIELFQATMDRIHSRQSVRLRVGTIDSIATFSDLDLSGAISRFMQIHADVLIELDTDTPARLQKSLLEAKRDVIISGSIQVMPGMNYAEITSEIHHLYCGDQHPWFDRSDADLTQEEFQAANFSVRSYMHFDDAYRLGHVTPSAKVGSMEAQEVLILSGRYVGFLPHHRGKIWQDQGRMRPVKARDIQFTSRFYAAYDPRGEGAPYRRALVEMLLAPETRNFDAVRSEKGHRP